VSERTGHGPWARLFASAVVRDEGSSVAEQGRGLVREGEVGRLGIEQGTLSALVAGCSVAITATPMPPRIWAAMTRFARGNRPLEEAIAGRVQSVHLEHLLVEDWSEPLVPRPYELGRTCSCSSGGELCEHVAALAYAVAAGIDSDPSLLLRWRGCGVVELPAPQAEAPAAQSVDLADPALWRAGDFPEPRPLRPLPVGAVLKRLGPSGLQFRGEDLATVLQRAYDSFARSSSL
jgi:uncharacterized Zn finger protein